jgi:hypothetical protein
VTQCLLSAIVDCRDGATDRLLGSLVDEAPLLPAAGDVAVRHGASGVDAHTLLAEYQPLAEMAQGAPTPHRGEVALACAEAQASIAAAVAKALPTVAEEGARRFLVELSLVLPFLATADDRWDPKATEALLRAPLSPAHLPMAEDFALHCGRPLTACGLSRLVEPSTGRPAAQLTYLQSAAARMSAARDPRAAVRCCEAGIRIAAAAGDQNALRAITVQLAAVLADTGNPIEAARHLEGLLAGNAQVTDRSSLVARRLDLLYQAGAYEEALHAAGQERDIAGADKVAPEVLHLLWACQRRLGHAAAAETSAAQLFDRFPRHPLAAGILLGEAVDALKTLDYRTADRLLAQVQTDFPGSKYAAQATEFREHLAVTRAAPAHQP